MSESRKRKRKRSPGYPALGLETAILRARELYDKEGTHFVAQSTVFEDWGYGPTSSHGGRVLAALLHFGLVETQGSQSEREVRLSDLGQVLTHANSPEDQKSTAVKAAALNPSIYQKLWEEWGTEGRLPSKGKMTWDLESTWEFNPRAIDSFISDFVSTLEFAELVRGGILVGGEASGGGGNLSDEAEETPEKPDRHEAVSPQPLAVGIVQEQTVGARIEQYRIPLPRGGTAVLSLPVPMSSAAFDMISAWLNLTKSAITEDGDSQAGNRDDGA